MELTDVSMDIKLCESFFLTALTAIYLPFVTQSVSSTLEFGNKDFWNLRSWKKTKRQKDKKTKIQKDKKTKRQKDKKAKRQRLKENSILWCQGSFVLLRCFHSFPSECWTKFSGAQLLWQMQNVWEPFYVFTQMSKEKSDKHIMSTHISSMWYHGFWHNNTNTIMTITTITLNHTCGSHNSSHLRQSYKP